MIKIGLIGAGFMGMTHALCYEALAGSADFQVTAVADDDPARAQKIADKFGAKVFADGTQLIEQADVNTIDICLPTFLHARHALLAMERGYHVFIEKPVCLEEEEAVQLLEVQKRTGANVMVGHCLRFWPEYAALKQIHTGQRYGKFISGVFSRISPRPAWGWQDWIHNVSRSGSVALDLHIHDVDFVRYLLGEPDEVSSQAVYAGTNIEHIFSQYHYGEAVVSLEATWDCPAHFPFEMSFRVKYEQAVIVFSCQKSPTLKIYGNDGSEIVPDLKTEASTANADRGGNISDLGGYLYELRYFLDRLAAGEPIVNASLTDGVASFRLAIKEIGLAAR
ncbi:Gfo/Idh/MocA family protein [Paenibacillus sp. GCM10027626]|uniref:Gfo/Idh/MocA family protein n=1 Tax=Paenibacillus sp. GCM10027626 TaxID=3273411 RepID=UPI003638BE84